MGWFRDDEDLNTTKSDIRYNAKGYPIPHDDERIENAMTSYKMMKDKFDKLDKEMAEWEMNGKPDIVINDE